MKQTQRNKAMWRHLRDDFADVAWAISCLFETLGAWLFGKITHDGYAVTWRKISYRIKEYPVQNKPQPQKENDDV